MAWCQPESHYLIFVYLGIESHLSGAANFQIVNQGLSLLRRWTMNEFTTINEKTIEEVVASSRKDMKYIISIDFRYRIMILDRN